MGSSYSNCLKSISGRDCTSAANPEVGVAGMMGDLTNEVTDNDDAVGNWYGLLPLFPLAPDL